MGKLVTLKKNYEFRRLYHRGKSTPTQALVLYSQRNRKGNNRVGITVTGKIGGAVVRNRIRRRLREIYRLHASQLTQGLDLVIVARVKSRYVSYQELERCFLYACQKQGLIGKNSGMDAQGDAKGL